jgi:hypothetical protein
MSIGGTITSATAGSVLFVGTSGVLQQDNANFFWNNTDKRLGINTASPRSYLEVVVADSGIDNGFNVTRVGGDTNPSRMTFRKARGTNASPTAVATGDIVGSLQFSPYSGSSFIGSAANVRGIVNGTVSTSSVPTDLAFHTGSTQLGSERMRILSDGNVGIGTGSTISARLHTISTTEQLRLGYDASNYFSTTVGSTGGVTFNAVGTGAGFTFSDSVAVSGLTTGSVLFAGASGAITQSNLHLFWDNTNKRLGIGTSNPSTGLHVIVDSGNQFRIGHDTSTHVSMTVADDGVFAVSGTGINETFMTSIGQLTVGAFVATGGISLTAVNPRVSATSSSATPTPNADTTDLYSLTGQAATAAFANPTGTPVNGQRLLVRIKDNGTARSITWGSAYVAGGAALPTTTVANKTMHLGFIYNTDNSLNKWMLIASVTEA